MAKATCISSFVRTRTVAFGPSFFQQIFELDVESVMVTVCGDVYVPVPGLIDGAEVTFNRATASGAGGVHLIFSDLYCSGFKVHDIVIHHPLRDADRRFCSCVQRQSECTLRPSRPYPIVRPA